MAQVILKDVAKKFDEVIAVKDFNLDVEDKEFVILVGPGKPLFYLENSQCFHGSRVMRPS
ncbi:hypothetical protein [Candidatus Hakubella thermalkaliphila]|uniref:Multiple sugar transport system ATP-binding protein n=1 Tax=Candidatus Hakubella thermalkaliphila TaxID=2754717 RepID=A0A6V8PCC5_9ACTN|nr:hypothetical protein [Candidatus Hakubella thermalkaliphila]GFP28541.1 hypothetical protein HKBW3S33_01956 [Candidatus Hakubella thermalkaliphila]